MWKQTRRRFGAFTRDFCAEDLLECLSINPGRIGERWLDAPSDEI